MILSDRPVLTAADLYERINGEMPAFDARHPDLALDAILDRCTREAVVMAHEHCGGNVARMADQLRKSPATVYRHMTRYGLRRGRERG